MSIYAIDFDGTLCEKAFPKIGAEKSDVVDYVKQLKSNGNTLILWTCRSGQRLDEAVQWCQDRGLEFDFINENDPDAVDYFGDDCRKVHADHYLDDKNMKLEDIIGSQMHVKGGDHKMKNKKYWSIRQKADSPKTAQLFIYGDIYGGYDYDFSEGTLKESETSAAHIRKELDALGDVETIELHINSMGGSCYEGNAIANMLRRHPAHTVAYIDAFACSEASVIACACKEVRMPRNTVMMIHDPWLYTSGNSRELRKAADDLDVMSAAFRTIYLEKAGDKLSEEKLIQLLEAETYLTAAQAKEYGLCDEIEDFDAKLRKPETGSDDEEAEQHVDMNRLFTVLQPAAKAEIPAETPGSTTEEDKRDMFLSNADALINKFFK